MQIARPSYKTFTRILSFDEDKGKGFSVQGIKVTLKVIGNEHTYDVAKNVTVMSRSAIWCKKNCIVKGWRQRNQIDFLKKLRVDVYNYRDSHIVRFIHSLGHTSIHNVQLFIAIIMDIVRLHAATFHLILNFFATLTIEMSFMTTIFFLYRSVSMGLKKNCFSMFINSRSQIRPCTTEKIVITFIMH